MVQPSRRMAKTDDVREVIKVMQNSPTAAYLRECSLHERIMLAALLKVIKREGVEEVRWGDVRGHSPFVVHLKGAGLIICAQVQHQHLIYTNVLTSADDPTRKPTLGELDMVLESLAASRTMLIEDGVAASRKAAGDRKVILNLEHGEVERVLSDVGGTRWKNTLSG
jgi:origin recognition complex subunit 1